MWLYLGVFSALFLGFYDISKKHSLRQNAVLPVLLYSCLTAAVIFLPFIILSYTHPNLMSGSGLYVPPITTFSGHWHLFLKSLIVYIAWILSYTALKHLPISIATPIGASAPLWTLLGAVLIFHEHPNAMQYAGLAIMIGSYYLYSIIGSKEGIKFTSDKWVAFIFAATLVGTLSGLYDKHLIQTLKYHPLTVQAWFFVYLVVLFAPTVWLSRFYGQKIPFIWRWSIPLIGIFLIVADFAYFRALTYQGSLIAMLATLRCSCVVISFLGGILLFKELRPAYKAVALTGVIAGVFMILTA
ncbi:MAG: DMT family transporter [Planctomycetaceae bacterium]|nr:DMT family transporter [Planctomycetaceae bacterium]